MATIQVPNLATQYPRHNTALGNMIVERYQLQVTAGLVNGVDIATGDVIILGILPAGWRLMPQFAKIVVSDAFGTGVTGTVGFAYIDGVDDTAVPQDADYFLLSNTLAATVALDGNNTAVTAVRLPKSAYLTVTLGGTSHDASAAAMDVYICAVNSGLL